MSGCENACSGATIERNPHQPARALDDDDEHELHRATLSRFLHRLHALFLLGHEEVKAAWIPD